MFFSLSRKGSQEIWPWILTPILVFVGYQIGTIPMMAVLFSKMGDNPDLGVEELESFTANPDFSIFGIDKNLGFVLMIIMFVCALGALWICVKYFHKRSLKDLITFKDSINWSKIFWAFGVWMLLGVGFEIILYFQDPSVYVYQLNWSKFIPLLLISFLLLPIQTSLEELVFRGYALQGLGNLTGSKLAALVITSVLFGLIHGMNPEVEKYGFWTMQMYYVSAGLILGIMTIMDDSLELALGVHAATNVYGALFLSYEGSALQTDTMFKTTEINPIMMFILLLLMGAIFLYLCYRKYNWSSFTKLMEPVDKTLGSNNDLAGHL